MTSYQDLPAYKTFTRAVLKTPEMQEELDFQTRLTLANLHVVVQDEKRGFCFYPQFRHHNLEPLREQRLLRLKRYTGENRELWKGTMFYHPTKRGIRIHDRLEEQGYDFAPPEGASLAGVA